MDATDRDIAYRVEFFAELKNLGLEDEEAKKQSASVFFDPKLEPSEMADGLAIRQFHAKAQEAVARIQADTTRIEQLESALKIIASGHGFPSDVAENALAPVSIN